MCVPIGNFEGKGGPRMATLDWMEKGEGKHSDSAARWHKRRKSGGLLYHRQKTF